MWQRLFAAEMDDFLKKIDGVIHVGANFGQERDIYASQGLNVLWVEPIPDVFRQLRENIRGLPKQRALNYLVTDRDDEECEFFLSDNQGESSSMLAFARHSEMWPNVKYVGSMALKSITLTTMLGREGVDVGKYQALVLDTQGAELRVLRGAEEIVRNFRYIKLEAPDFESYQGCCTVRELSEYLLRYGFREISRNRFGYKENVGSYYDIVYRRQSADLARRTG